MSRTRHRLLTLCFALAMCGCGTAIQRNGTEQLLLSNSVDHAIDQLDLSGLAGRRVYLDTEYMRSFKGSNIHISSDYIISALRQKLTTTGCQIQMNRADADYVLEARVGALGTDTMEVTYGIPASNGVGAAASALGGTPVLPSIPEVSIGKRNGAMGVSKIVVYAYHRETGIPVWQSGAAVARSDARDSWFLGVGPLTRGSVYDGVSLAGNRINPPFEKKDRTAKLAKPLTIDDRHSYIHPAALEKQLAEAKQTESRGSEAESQGIQTVSHAGSTTESSNKPESSGHATIPNSPASAEPPKGPSAQ